jgi:GT2 family glycosyltransferase
MSERTENMPAPIALRDPGIPHQISGSDATSRVAIIMTSHNRREKTIACLQALSASQCVGHVELNAVLADDGSTDGTAEAVGQAYPWVRVVYGDGSLFWCRGMHRAFEAALQQGFDYYLWLNDDTMLYADALSRLLDCAVTQRALAGKPVIVVGSTVDEDTGKPTYGGERRTSPWRRTSFELVQPGDRAQPCDSMDGNIVLIPAETARLAGNLDPVFEHAMGDTDYGLRALKLGVGIWVAPGVHGTCGHNSASNTFMDPVLPLSKRWRLMLGRKGLPWRSWWMFTRRHTGVFWPVFFLWPYARVVLNGVTNSIRISTGK